MLPLSRYCGVEEDTEMILRRAQQLAMIQFVLAMWIIVPRAVGAQTVIWPCDEKQLMTTYGEFQHFGYLDPPSYLHNALDIASGQNTLVRSITKGKLMYARFGHTTISGGSVEEADEWQPWDKEFIIIEDVNAGGEGTAEGWLYAHIRVASIKELIHNADLEEPEVWELNPNQPFTRLADYGYADHLHLERVKRLSDSWTESPIPIENPLMIFKDADLVGTDSQSPVFGWPEHNPPIAPIAFDPDEQAQQDGMSDPFPVAGVDGLPVLFGRADVIAFVRDKFNPPSGEDLDFPPHKRLGVHSIGYQVLRSDNVVLGPYTRRFEGEIQTMRNEALTKAIYRITDRFRSQNEYPYYAVTNYYPGSLPGDGWSEGMNWTPQVKYACWNTRMMDQGGLPWTAEDATQIVDPGQPGYPKFPDELYTVRVHASDLFNDATPATQDVIVDNFAPFVKEVRVTRNYEEWTPEGLDPTPGQAIVYHGKWAYQQNGGCSLSILHREASPVDDVLVTIKFSEAMKQGDGTPTVKLIHEGTSSDYSPFPGAWDPEDPTTYFCYILIPELTGTFRISIVAEDWAGNSLDIDLSQIASRAADGSWDDPTYNPESNNADEHHSLVIAPDVWIVEGTSNHEYPVSGLRADGSFLAQVNTAMLRRSAEDASVNIKENSLPDNPDNAEKGPRLLMAPHAQAISDASDASQFHPDLRSDGTFVMPDNSSWYDYDVRRCASDPVDGGCWLYWIRFPGDLVKAKASGEIDPEMTICLNGGTPLWVGVEHRTQAVWVLVDRDEIWAERYERENNAWAMIGVALDHQNHRTNPCAASLDQRSGDLWVGLSEWVSPEWHSWLCKVEGSTMTKMEKELVMSDDGGWSYPQVAANPQDGSVWVAAKHNDIYPCVWFDVAKYDGGLNLVHSYIRLQGFCDDEHFPFMLGGAGISGFQQWNGCVAAFLAGQTYTYPHVPPDRCDLPRDTLVVVGDQVSAGYDLSVRGCNAQRGEEFIESCHLSVTPKGGGIWLVRHRMLGDMTNCDYSAPNEGRDYLAEVFLIRPDGQKEDVFSILFDQIPWACTGWWGYLQDYGITSISACAGALWDEWPAEAQYVGVTPQGAALSITPVSEPKPFVYHLGPIYPNPCRECNGAIIDYGIGGGGGRVRLEIYDLNGRIIRRVVNGSAMPGAYRSEWNLFDDLGMRVPSAAYVVQLQSEGYVTRQKYVVMK